MHSVADEAGWRTNQPIQVRRLCVFLPSFPLFTPLTGTDVRLREAKPTGTTNMNEEDKARLSAGTSTLVKEADSLDSQTLLPLPVSLDPLHGMPSWADLPANPLCGATPSRTRDLASHVLQPSAAPSQSQRLQPPQPSSHTSPSFDGNDTFTKSKRRLLSKEDYPYYCDACQKGFKQEDKYDQHLSSHIYCTVPGCRFTCRGDRAWKMEEHLQLLHHRANAPDLVDVERYLAQRRARFPTREVIEQKVEELYYKAARGVVLPVERRRWMRQHRVEIYKRHRSDASYLITRRPPAGVREATGERSQSETPPHDTSASAPQESQKATREKTPEASPPDSPPTSRHSSANRSESTPADRSRALSQEKGSGPELVKSPAPTLRDRARLEEASHIPTSKSSSSSSSSTTASASVSSSAFPPCLRAGASRVHPTVEGGKVASARPGPASLTSSEENFPSRWMAKSKTQIRPPHTRPSLRPGEDKALHEGPVPRYYVCNRCGEKGSHWLRACPTRGNPLFDRHLIWGEPRQFAHSKPKPTEPAREETTQPPPCQDAEPGREEVPHHAAGPGTGEVGIDAAPPHEPGQPHEPNGGAVSQPQTPVPSPAVGSPLRENEDAVVSEADSDALPPVAVPARPASTQSLEASSSAATKEVTRVMAPVAAKRFLQERAQRTQRRYRGAGGLEVTVSRRAARPREPTLFERLTEEDRLNEKGLLLQAIRFFVMEDFFL